MAQAVECVELDREAFRKTLQLKALRVPAKQSHAVSRRVKPYLLTLSRVKPVQHDAEEGKRLILLETSTGAIPEAISQLVQQEDVELVDYELSLGYERLTTAEVLRKLLPDDVAVPSAFESVGRVAHLNLRPEHAPYKYAIGQVLLDKNPAISTVINKVASLENEFRLMEYEILAGEPSLETETRQSGCRYRMDFAKVYWNSRLEHEHTRLVERFRPGETVLDLMAGIGPFAIPAAKKGCYVVANDKNPESYRYLRENIALNRVVDRVLPLNLDARFCVRLVMAREDGLEAHLPENYAEELAAFRQRQRRRSAKRSKVESFILSDAIPSLPLHFHHAVMNYPHAAISFLDAFRGVLDSGSWCEAEVMPWVHCYAFMRESETPETLKQRCEAALEAELNAEVHIVRDVAPAKVMCCISFRLPRAAALEPTADAISEHGGGMRG